LASAVFLATIQEGAGGADVILARFLWEIINDAQATNWATINSAQTVTWAEINTSQSTTWQTVKTQG
jgi:hypothetical protein